METGCGEKSRWPHPAVRRAAIGAEAGDGNHAPTPGHRADNARRRLDRRCDSLQRKHPSPPRQILAVKESCEILAKEPDWHSLHKILCRCRRAARSRNTALSTPILEELRGA